MFGYVSISSSLCKERCCTKTADDAVVAISEEPNSVVRSGGGNVVRMYCMREASIFNNIFFKDQVRRLYPSQSVLQRFAISSEENNSIFDTHVEVC